VRKMEKMGRVGECGGRSKRLQYTLDQTHVPLPTTSQYRHPCIDDNFMVKVCVHCSTLSSAFSYSTSKDSTNRASSNNTLTMVVSISQQAQRSFKIHRDQSVRIP
jgi:hypothetical protein